MALLSLPVRVCGQRRYNAAILERPDFIGAARGLGFSLDEIRPVPDTGVAELAEASPIQHALLDGLECGCPDLPSCLGCIVAHVPPAVL